MIREVRIKGFKRFVDVIFTLPGHVVVAGPNNTGKTTLLQAIAAWSLALKTWERRNDFQRHGGAYSKVPITRQAFSAVPLRAFDLLWTERGYAAPIESNPGGSGGDDLRLIVVPVHALIPPKRSQP